MICGQVADSCECGNEPVSVSVRTLLHGVYLFIYLFIYPFSYNLILVFLVNTSNCKFSAIKDTV
jgi:hypothetical protein